MDNVKRKKITPEIQAKLDGCSSSEEILELAQHEGYLLSEEQLEQISGGSWLSNSCPACGSDTVGCSEHSGYRRFTCMKCGHQWDERD